jgi:hypothetical protein
MSDPVSLPVALLADKQKSALYSFLEAAYPVYRGRVHKLDLNKFVYCAHMPENQGEGSLTEK